jgi:chromosome segregation ATPase
MNVKKKTYAVCAVVALTALALASGREARAQVLNRDPESVKTTDRLIKSAEDLVKQVSSAKDELDKTLATYNSIFAAESDKVKSIYSDIEKAIEKCEKQKDEVQKRLDAMKLEGDAYFASRKAANDAISDADLRKKSEDRLAETRKQYDEIFERARKSRADYEPFVKSLRDQWTYLGHDLNTSGIASLKPDAEKLNAQAKTLLAEITEGMKKATEYIDSLRP